MNTALRTLLYSRLEGAFLALRPSPSENGGNYFAGSDSHH